MLDGQSSHNLLYQASHVKRHCSARIDLHSARLSASFDEDWATVIPTFDLNPYRTTGAGDSWNAANIFAHILKLSAAERLLFANAMAGYYAVSVAGKQASLEELIEFIENTALRGSELKQFRVDDDSVDYESVYHSN
jgi:hypothetical protein